MRVGLLGVIKVTAEGVPCDQGDVWRGPGRAKTPRNAMMASQRPACARRTQGRLLPCLVMPGAHSRQPTGFPTFRHDARTERPPRDVARASEAADERSDGGWGGGGMSEDKMAEARGRVLRQRAFGGSNAGYVVPASLTRALR